jgi:nucleotide-binding universal stress UspA family protein
VEILEKVLYAVDFSAHQRLALPCLTKLKDAGCRDLILLHVKNDERAVRRVPALLRLDVLESLTNAVGDRLDQWSAFCEAEGLSARAITVEADLPWLEICDLARDERVSLVVLGPRAAGDPASCAYFLMHAQLSAGALLLLKTTDSFAEEWYGNSCRGLFGRVLLATDWSECALRAEEYVAHLKGIGVDEVVVAHVAEGEVPEAESGSYRLVAEKRLAESCRSLEEAGLTARSLFVSGDPSRAIGEAARNERVSLIIMGSTGKSVSVEQLVGSVSERVAVVSDVSVLLVY